MNSRLRHERDGLAGLVRRVLDDVLVLHDVVGGRQQRVVAHVDLGLAGGADLVVVHLDLDADLLEVQHHLGCAGPGSGPSEGRGSTPPCTAACSRGSGRRRRLAPGVPDAFDRIDVVVALVLVLVEPDRVEDVELGLRAPVRDVGDARSASGTARPSSRCSAGRGCTSRRSPGPSRSS